MNSRFLWYNTPEIQAQYFYLKITIIFNCFIKSFHATHPISQTYRPSGDARHL